jgi:hypothetical protein
MTGALRQRLSPARHQSARRRPCLSAATNLPQSAAMRWTGRFLVALIVVWAIYFFSPYVALYGLAKAIEAKDVAAIEERVNFPAVRSSLAKQLIPAYLIATGRESELKGTRGQAVVGFGATVADPLIARYLSPAALSELLEDPRLASGNGGSRAITGGSIGLNSLHDAWRLFVTAQSRGFRAVSFAVPVDRLPSEQFRLQLRIKGLGWRLVGIELPKPVLDRLVKELIKSNPAAS